MGRRSIRQISIAAFGIRCSKPRSCRTAGSTRSGTRSPRLSITDNQSPKLVQTLLGHHSAAFTMDVYSDLWPTALEGIGERIAATLFSGDGSKVVAATPNETTDGGPTEAQVIDLNGGPCRDRTYDKEIKSLLLYQLS
jgi:hypothetical protein